MTNLAASWKNPEHVLMQCQPQTSNVWWVSSSSGATWKRTRVAVGSYYTGIHLGKLDHSHNYVVISPFISCTQHACTVDLTSGTYSCEYQYVNK